MTAVLLAVILSCKKEKRNLQADTKPNSVFKADEALKSYQNFKSYLSTNQNKPSNVSVNSLKSENTKNIPFDIINTNPYSSEMKDFYFVEFPIKYKYKNGVLPERTNQIDDNKRIEASVDRIIVKKNKKSGIIDFELITYVPSQGFVNQPYDIKENQYGNLSKSFTGLILHKNIGGEQLYLEKISNGEVVKKLYKQKGAKPNSIKVSSNDIKTATLNCNTICYDDFVLDETCQCFVWGTVCYTDCYETSSYPGVSLDNGVLAFESNQAFYDLYNQLDNGVETYNDNFYDPKASLTDDQVEVIEIQENFDEYKPLRDFESYFGFASLRQKIETEENAWMDNTTLDPSTDPDFIYTEPDEVMQSFFNQNKSVKIAGNYFSTPEQDDLIIYSNTTNSTTQSSCNNKLHKRYSEPNTQHIYDGGNKSAKFVASFNGLYLLVATRLVARTKNFKRKSNGHWKKFATICYAHLGGIVNDAYCYDSDFQETRPKSEKRRRSFKASTLYFANTLDHINKNEMIGNHTVGTFINFNKSFTW